MEAIATRDFKATPTAVAAVMFDPRRDPDWIGGAKRVDAPGRKPTKIGTRVTRHGGFLGRKFSWTTEVAGFEPDHLLHMDFVDGPMKGGTVTYRIDKHGTGSRVSIRNTGPGPAMMAWFIRRSVAKDLDRLAKLLEG